MLMLRVKTNKGFTIVELLIVIVVIGILAAITIVAYNGVTNNAKIANAQANAAQAAQKMGVYKVQNADSYPAGTNNGGSITNLASAAGLPSTSNVTAYLTDATNSNYCLTVTNGTTSYSTSSTSSSPIAGTCVENIATDPSAAYNASYFGASGSNSDAYSSVTISSLLAQSGSTSLRKVVSTANPSGAGATVRSTTAVPANATVNYSFWVNAPRALTINPYIDIYKVSDGTYGCGGTSNYPPVTTVPNVWTKVSGTLTPAVDCNIYAGGYNMQASVGDALYFDSYMVTVGGNYAYGDGNSPGWFWEGTPNNSASIGPSIAQ